MKRVAVTGGAGFIGSHIAGKLIGQGNQVVVLDDLSTGNFENIPKEAEFIQGSILDSSLLKKLFRDTAQVFHLAAIASVPQSIEHPELTYQVNIDGTFGVLAAARDAGVRKVILASSSAIYGDTTTAVQNEELPPHPISPYAISKLRAEKLAGEFTDQFNLPTACLRYFNVYGEGQNPHSQYALVVPAFINNAKQGLPLTIHGDGRQERDFVFIDDVVAATIFAAESDMTGVYNVGSGRPVSILELAHTICKLTRSRSQLLFDEPREGDPLRTCADITKLASAGFTPSWNIDKGIERIMDGY